MFVRFIACAVIGLWLGRYAVGQTESKPLPADSQEAVTGRPTAPTTSAHSMAGTWHCQFETPMGLQAYHFVFSDQEALPTVTAVVESEEERREIKFGDVLREETSCTFAESRTLGERELRITYRATLDGNFLQVTRSFGNGREQQAMATRQPPSPRPKQFSKPVVVVKIDKILKDAYHDSFLIGMAGDLPERYSNEELQIASGHFNAITPENCMKPERIHPVESSWQFERADSLVNWAKKHAMTVHGHTLVWHQQTPNWFFEGGEREEVTSRLKNHIETIVGRYRGRVQSWDVVNEAINDGGDGVTGQSENLRHSKWLETMGPDFLTLAFKFAHQADPDAVLYYNDYNIESGPKHQSSLVLLKRLLKEGAPVHAVGIQGHWRTGQVPYEAIDQAISDYASLGLKVSITELDVTIRGESGGQFGRGFGRARGAGQPEITADDLNEQAASYGKLFAVLQKHKDVIERVTFWGLNDRRTWRWGQHPLLFDASNHPKPAYAAIVKQSDVP